MDAGAMVKVRSCLERTKLLQDLVENGSPPSFSFGRATKTRAVKGLGFSSSSSPPDSLPLKYAILGAGFAGLSVAWHLLQNSPRHSHICVDLYDQVGIGGGASGVAGGLLHPYSPKAKLLWKAAECWKESQKLLTIAEAAENARARDLGEDEGERLVWRRGILRPATAAKNVTILKENAKNGLANCRIQYINGNVAQNLVPGLCTSYDAAVYMPEALTIHPKQYLQALYLACQNLANESSRSGYGGKEIHMYKQTVDDLLKFAGDYSAVIVCLGAKASLLPELLGQLPLRTCRGVVVHLELPEEKGGEYGDQSPSILADAWLAVQGPRRIVAGSTWDWNSKNAASAVSGEEASTALEELVTKASFVYPKIRNWSFMDARAGLRAMPPLTPLGSLPIVGSVDDIVQGSTNCRYWLIGGLGSRGLFYHGWLGKLMADAVLSSSEQGIPGELLSWKRRKTKENMIIT